MKLEYPNEPWFRDSRFGDCPVVFVEQALEAIRERDWRKADFHATPIAAVGQWIAASKGLKDPSPTLFNPYAELLYRQYAKATMGEEVARTFLNLSSKNQVPTWVLDVVDIQLIRAAAHE